MVVPFRPKIFQFVVLESYMWAVNHVWPYCHTIPHGLNAWGRGTGGGALRWWTTLSTCSRDYHTHTSTYFQEVSFQTKLLQELIQYMYSICLYYITIYIGSCFIILSSIRSCDCFTPERGVAHRCIDPDSSHQGNMLLHCRKRSCFHWPFRGCTKCALMIAPNGENMWKCRILELPVAATHSQLAATELRLWLIARW